MVKKEICYLQWLIEASQGIASLKTIDSTKGEVEISVAPGCEDEVLSLINHLSDEGVIHVTEKRFL